MSMGFADQLVEAVRRTRSVAVVGIDPTIDQLPPEIQELASNPQTLTDGLTAFGKGLVDAVCGLVPAVKPNIAFFEAHGVAGLMAYVRICSYARRNGLLVIGDVKRGDIGSTAAAYAHGLLRPVPRLDDASDAVDSPFQLGPHHALTINPYLGWDSIAPFVDGCRATNAGLYVLVKTSNPSSAEFQDLVLADGSTVAEAVAKKVHAWGESLMGGEGLSSIGAVIGATHPEQLAMFRELMPHTSFLVPGYGAQGGGAADVVGAFRHDGTGALINASRSVMNAWQKEKTPQDWRGASRRAVETMNEDLRAALSAAGRAGCIA